MELSATDPYELKLFQMFESCDKEHCGLLDASALQRLCGLLELHDNGAVLIANLASTNVKGTRVSFESFKEALLNFLGSEMDISNAPGATTTLRTPSSIQQYKVPKIDDSMNNRKECSLVICEDNAETFVESAESSDREVLPKFVVGLKKYGRRSRPQTHGADDTQSLSDSDDPDTLSKDHRNCSAFNCCHQTVYRSTSQTDIPNNRRRRLQLSNGGSKLKRCSSLPAEKKPSRYVKSTTAKKTNPPKEALSQQQQLGSSQESLDSPTYVETLAAAHIIDIWERANIVNGKGILLALGFDEDEVNLAQLNKVLEEEVRSLEDDPQVVMLRAVHALQTAELTTLQQSYRQMHAENAKLRADNKEANRRARELAAEIDERHASLEDSSKKELRALEQRHAGVVRDLSERMTIDRENSAILTANLESRIKSLEKEEIRTKTDLELVRNENSDLETELQKFQKQITELLEENIQLNREIAELQDNTRCEIRVNSPNKPSDEDEMLRLMDKFAILQADNTKLRDKNDELVTEVENLSLELARANMKHKKSSPGFNEPTDEHMAQNESIDGDTITIATKQVSDLESNKHITAETPEVGVVCKLPNTKCVIRKYDDECLPLDSELQCTTSARDCIHAKELKTTISVLEDQLEKLLNSSQANSNYSVFVERIKKLETSLEQMQNAYEDCEDYWQSKLAEERKSFHNERRLFEEEQSENDHKFTELLEKVRQYEEQYEKDESLPPIGENSQLEEQYSYLENEFEQFKQTAMGWLDDKHKEIEKLRIHNEDLQVRLSESAEIITGANELTNEISIAGIEDSQSPASSPISYLWHQSTIQEPAKTNMHLVTDQNNTTSPLELLLLKPPKGQHQVQRKNLSTSETTIFSTAPENPQTQSTHSSLIVSPIQKPSTASCKTLTHSEGDAADCDTSSSGSERNSVASTQSIASQSGQNAQNANNSQALQSCQSPSGLKEELKRLKFFEISLREQIKDLSLQRDGLVMELQQLQEARPVLEKAYARTAHPSLIQRVDQLELKNRHLQNVIKQQQQYTESLMQQSWRQYQVELNDLHGRIEAQGVMIAEQVQRLQNADILVKDLYVENAHLTANVQQLEQQRARTNLIQQQHQQQQQHHHLQVQQQQQQRHGTIMHGLPGMP